MKGKARLINVIMVEEGDTQAFFTLQGTPIGTLKGGTLEEPAKTPEPPPEVKKGGVVKSLTPAEAKVEKDKEADKRVGNILDRKNE